MGLAATQGFSVQPSSLHPSLLLSPSASAWGIPSAHMLTAGSDCGEPTHGECGSRRRDTRKGPAEPCLGRAQPSQRGERQGTAQHPASLIPLSRLAALQKVQPALKQPASLLRKPASVSIATARDGEYHSTAAWPVSHVPTQHAGQAEAEGPPSPAASGTQPW